MKREALIAVLLVALLLLSPVYALAVDRNFEFKNGAQLKTLKQAEGQLKRIREKVKLQSAFRNSYVDEATADSNRLDVKRFAAAGDLVEISDKSITVKINRASGSFKQLVGQTVTFSLVEEAKVAGRKELERLGLGILPGTKAVITGYEKEGSYFAAGVVIKLPGRVVLNGKITALTGSGFVMEVHAANMSRGNTPEAAEIVIYDKTRLSYPASVTPELKEGLYVNVVGYRKGDKVYAVRVAVKAKPEVTDMETTETPESTETVSTETALTTSTTHPGTTDTVEGAGTAGKGLITSIVREIREFLKSLLGFLETAFK